jgi:hypothetical protein
MLRALPRRTSSNKHPPLSSTPELELDVQAQVLFDEWLGMALQGNAADVGDVWMTA